jgi:hypothetical protein
MVSIFRRQQLVHSSQDESSLLVNRGDVGPGHTIHRLLSDLGRIFLQLVVVQVHHDECAQIHDNLGRLRERCLVLISQHGNEVREI